MKIACFITSVVLLLILNSFCVIQHYQFSIGCSGHLKRAADANTIQTAKVELRTALAYMQTNGLTKGYVSIFLKQPKNDLGFWHTNLSQALEELEIIPDNTTQLEKSNVLMKLRETILDDAARGTVVTHPSFVSIHPHNATIFFLSLALCVVCFVSWWRVYADLCRSY